VRASILLFFIIIITTTTSSASAVARVLPPKIVSSQQPADTTYLPPCRVMNHVQRQGDVAAVLRQPRTRASDRYRDRTPISRAATARINSSKHSNLKESTNSTTTTNSSSTSSNSTSSNSIRTTTRASPITKTVISGASSVPSTKTQPRRRASQSRTTRPLPPAIHRHNRPSCRQPLLLRPLSSNK